MKTATIKLTHTCNVTDLKGEPGTVLTVPQDRANYIIARGGAVLVSPPDTKAEARAEAEKKEADHQNANHRRTAGK